MSWAVVRVRGQVNVKPKIKETMRLMRLNRVNHCVIIPENDTYQGMLNIIKDYVTWGEVDHETTQIVLESSAKKSGRQNFTKSDLKGSPFKTIKALAKGLSEGKAIVRDIPSLKPIFRLHLLVRDMKESNAVSRKEEH